MKAFPEFDAPIPGESLTAELGSRPWQSPPQYAKVEDVMSFYIEKITEPKASSKLVVTLDNDIPISVIVNSLMLSSVMEGIHTIDVGIIVTPFLIEMCEHLANEAGIEYTTGLEEEEDDSILDTIAAKNAMKKFKEQTEDTESSQEIKEDTLPVDSKPESKGLMAKPAQEIEGVM